MSGPFQGYFAPGVTTETNLEAAVGGLLGNLRVPAIIGTSEETKFLDGYELVRGSSASVDQRKTNEDVSGQFTGTERSCTVSTFPIVTGEGSGTISNNVNHVEVKVNGEIAIVAALVGSTGTVTLALAPSSSDVVTVSYYYKKTDTKVTDEDVSAQFDGTETSCVVGYYPIVDGSNGGRATTNVGHVTVKVNGAIETVTHLDGANGEITLENPPGGGDTVTVTYYYNMHANTADDLPVTGVISMQSVGYSPETYDYIENIDYAVIGDQIQWGTGYKLVTNTHTVGAEYFDEDQITANTVDEKVYNEDVSAQFTGTEKVLTVAHYPIVDGTGKDIITNSPSHVIVKVNAAEVDVTKVEGELGKVYLEAIPGGGDTVTITYWFSRMEDDTYTIESVVAGATGVGTYKVTSAEDGQLGVATPGAENVAAGGFTGASYTTGPTVSKGATIDETVTLTFSSATEFAVTSSVVGGSTGSGKTDETYIDAATGLIFTLAADPLYAAADTLEIDVVAAATFTTSVIPITSIPGMLVVVNNTTDVTAGDSVDMITFDKSGNEPAVGDVYYVSLTYERDDYTCKFYTKFTEVTNEYGQLSQNNPITLSAYLMFLNGANALITCQVQKTAGSEDAADTAYYDVLDRLKKDVDGVNPAIIFAATSSQSVITAVSQHCSVQSSKRNRRERIGFFSYSVGTEPLDAADFASSIRNERMIAVYPDGAVMEFVDAEGYATDVVVDGTYLAAALIGVNVNNAFDVATPMTRKQIIGFKKLVRSMDETTMDLVAVKGVTIIENISGVLRVRHGLTTNMDSTLTKEINITTVKDFIQQEARRALDPFIGRKFLTNIPSQIVATMASMLRAAVEAELIIDFKNISAEKDTSQPDFIRVTAFYQPVLGVNYIDVTLNLRTRL